VQADEVGEGVDVVLGEGGAERGESDDADVT